MTSIRVPAWMLEPDHWVHCFKCARVMQVRDLVSDADGFQVVCPFKDDESKQHIILSYEETLENNSETFKHWPQSTFGMKKGDRLPWKDTE